MFFGFFLTGLPYDYAFATRGAGVSSKIGQFFASYIEPIGLMIS
jgi:hypothetical protein